MSISRTNEDMSKHLALAFIFVVQKLSSKCSNYTPKIRELNRVSKSVLYQKDSRGRGVDISLFFRYMLMFSFKN